MEGWKDKHGGMDRRGGRGEKMKDKGERRRGKETVGGRGVFSPTQRGDVEMTI